MEDDQFLTLPIARQVLFASFLLSQGHPSLQQNLFEWIALRRPLWRLTEAISHELETLDASVIALIDAGLHKNPENISIPGEIKTQIGIFQRTLEVPYEIEVGDRQANLLRWIIQEMIRRDHLYLSYSIGRPRSEEAKAHPTHPRRDPYFSFVCYYILNGNRLGVRVFDELFSILRDDFFHQGPQIKDIMTDKLPRKQFFNLLDLYNQTHPDAPVPFFIEREQDGNESIDTHSQNDDKGAIS